MNETDFAKTLEDHIVLPFLNSLELETKFAAVCSLLVKKGVVSEKEVSDAIEEIMTSEAGAMLAALMEKHNAK